MLLFENLGWGMKPKKPSSIFLIIYLFKDIRNSFKLVIRIRNK